MTQRLNLCLNAVVIACAFAATVHAQQPAPAGSHPAAAGETLFHEKGCEHCHGATFAGVPEKGPALLTVGRTLKKDAIEKQIRDGGREMPAFVDALQPDEIAALVDMLSKKKRAPRGIAASKPSPQASRSTSQPNRP